jgi:hypothetical protein
MRADFGARHEVWLRAFIDNSPRSTSKEREPREIEGELARRDPVLRIDRIRFNEIMPDILADVMNDSTIQAPFKPNWTAPKNGF